MFTWARQFKGSRESVENKSHDRRPRLSLADDNIRAIQEPIEGDHQLTVDKMHWETLDHSLYSPGLSLCDYFLLAPMKESLGGEQFENNGEVEEYVCSWLTMRPQTFFEQGIFKLPNCWQKCVECTGGHVEKN